MEATNFKILVIDDNPSIHRDFVKILKTESTTTELDQLNQELFGKSKPEEKKANFIIDNASQGQEGVQRIADALKENKPYSLAFVDIRMPPGWDGIETTKRIWELDKNIQIVICTAYSDYTWEETVEHLGKTDNLLILKKPFDNVSVRQLACALTRKWQLAAESRKYTDMLQHQVSDRTLSLQKSLSLIKSTFESSNDGIVVINNAGEIIDYNQKFLDLFHIPMTVINTKNSQNVFNFLNNQLTNPDHFISQIEKWKKHPDKISIEVYQLKDNKNLECYSQPHKLNDVIIGRILNFRDITKRIKLEDELKYQATHDSLTGLANRVQLLEKIRDTMKICDKNKKEFAVLFLDLDRFKLINDSLSHLAGDAILIATAKRLQNLIRPNDLLARLGGDEFVIVLMDVLNTEDLIKKINHIFTVFQEPFSIEDRKITLTASIGVCIYPKDGNQVDVLLRNSDAAMYQAKAQKGNNYQLYNSQMSIKVLAKLDEEMELRQAIAKEEFFLCYQPQINLTGEELVAVEALIRWQHPTRGVLLPIDFIELAEETGLVIAINEWVMKTACAQNKAWQEAGYPFIRVAVNVTAQQFKQGNVVETVKRILKETQLKPEYLELELTENVILSNVDVMNTVNELKKLGVIIAIDDFGTGYSTLSYLHKIPLDRLKIDSSFIQHIHSSTDDEVIIRAIIAMAKNLNLEVLAEGVETIEQLNFLKKNKCKDVQGFYFSKPLSKDEIEKYFTHSAHIKKLLLDT